jgi:dihydrofolate reductase
MNNLPKFVFFFFFDRATWKNTTLVKSNMPDEVLKLKRESTRDMVIMGSGSIVAQLANEGLIDEFQVVTNPIALGKGKKFLEGVTKKLDLKLAKSRIFANGNALATFRYRDSEIDVRRRGSKPRFPSGGLQSFGRITYSIFGKDVSSMASS